MTNQKTAVRINYLLKYIRERALLTTRGWAIFFGIGILLWGPVYYNNDIVAASISWTASSLLLVFTAGVVVGSSRSSRIIFELFSPHEEIISNQPFFIMLKSSPFKVLPFWEIKIALEKDYNGLEIPILKFKGSRSTQQAITIEASTRHRGEWRLIGINLEVTDSFGLSKSRVKFPIKNCIVRAYPPNIQIVSPPIISSSERPGDTVTDINNRQGEYFDLKSYHPADGAHRIAWKVFARRGELLSRHPEPSMTPEGHVLIVVCAFKNDDELASKAVNYAKYLEEMGLNISATCLGNTNRGIASSAQRLSELLVDSVWDLPECNLQGLLSTLHTNSPNIKVTKIVMLCSSDGIDDHEKLSLIIKVAQEISSLQIAPVFLVHKLPSMQSQTLLSTCLKNNWEVIEC